MSPAPSAWRSKIADPVLALLRQGVSPADVALAVLLGLAFCVFPLAGIPTLLCLVAAGAWKLNLPLIQSVNYLGAPLQWLLFIPFMRIGERLLGYAPLPLTLDKLRDTIEAGGFAAIRELGSAIAHACLGWLAVVPATATLAYLAIRRISSRNNPDRIAGLTALHDCEDRGQVDPTQGDRGKSYTTSK